MRQFNSSLTTPAIVTLVTVATWAGMWGSTLPHDEPKAAMQPVVLDYVFMVKSMDCVAAPRNRTLTGFRVQAGASRPTGIVTALHGVAGCARIVAANRKGHYIRNLHLRRVSVSEDLALLSTDSLDHNPSSGFTVGGASAAQLAAMGQPFVAGHPYGQLGVDSQPVQFPNPSIETIALMVVGSQGDALSARASPDPSRRAIAVLGPIAPGHSGAPLYSGSAAVAVVSGGQLNLPAGKSWAIPLADAQWSATTSPLPASVLGTPQASTFYVFESDDKEPIAGPLQFVPGATAALNVSRESTVGRSNQFILTQASITADGTVRARVHIRNENALMGFCATSAIALFDSSGNLLGSVAAGSQWCVDGKLLSPVTSPSTRDEQYTGRIDSAVAPRIARAEIIHERGDKDVVGEFLRGVIQRNSSP
jgi:hypothetical protein